MPPLSANSTREVELDILEPEPYYTDEGQSPRGAG